MIMKLKSTKVGNKHIQFEKAQKELLTLLTIPNEDAYFSLQKGNLIFCIDVHYTDILGYVAIDVSEWGNNDFKEYVFKDKTDVDYEPGYFAFREGPLILHALNKLKEQFKLKPSLLIVNGHGTAHPRKMGLACFVGIQSGIPTIGVAKESLIPIRYTLSESSGAFYEIEKYGEVIGTVLRTQTGIKPIFISSGHLISQKKSAEIIYSLRGNYRQIEPMRRADQAARKFAKGIIDKTTIEIK